MIYLASILFLLFMGIVFFILISLAYAGFSAAPWVPLSNKEIRRMLRLAEVKPGEKVYDLGSGDGRILIIAAGEFGAETVGYEISILPYVISKIRVALAGLKKKIKINFSSFYKTDLGQADVVAVFLLPAALEKLGPKFKKELKPGARIVSYAFAMKGWEPVKVDKPDPKTMSIYLYQA